MPRDRARLAVYLICLFCAPVGRHCLAEENEPLPLGEPPIIWGNLNRDPVVDLKDLNILATTYDGRSELERGGLLDDLKVRFGEDFPAVFNDLGHENRHSIGLPGTSATKETEGPSDAKQTSGLGIGFGVTFPDPITWRWGERIYNGNRELQQNTEIQIPTDDPDYDRYNFVSEQTDARFIDTYAEELDFKRYSVSAEAKYLAFTGNLSVNYQENASHSRRQHRFIAKRTIDFGWFWIPPDQRVLSDETLAELRSPFSEVYGKYGTHYIWAEHRVAELYVEIDVLTESTSVSEDFNLELEARLKGAWSLDLATAIANAKSEFSEISDVLVRIESHGGPPVSRSISVDSQEQMELMDQVLREWQTNLEPDGSNGPVKEYYVRPITDFIDTSTVSELGADLGIRSWFFKYAEVHRGIQRLEEILEESFETPTYENKYFHYSLFPISNNLSHLFETWLDFFSNSHNFYLAQQSDLLVIGAELLAEERTGFDASEFPIRTINEPQPILRVDGREALNRDGEIQIENACDRHERPDLRKFVYLSVNGGPFTAGSGYEVQWIDSNNAYEDPPVITAEYDPDTKQTHFVAVGYPQNNRGRPGENSGNCEFWSLNMPGQSFRLVHEGTGNVLASVCVRPDCLETPDVDIFE